MEPGHRYGRYIAEEDPRAPQPPQILTSLKPHQLASLHKAMLWEQKGEVFYNVEPTTQNARHRGNFSVLTNTAILGDMIGYGKTLTALAMIASTPTEQIHVKNTRVHAYYSSRSCSYIQIESENVKEPGEMPLMETTLVVVPHGPVYQQWQKAVAKETSLRHLAIDDLRVIRKKCPPPGAKEKDLRDFFGQYDLVLVKNTNMKKLLDYYDAPIPGFARIMLDEAHDIMGKMPILNYRFLWMISATYHQLDYSNSSYNMGVVLRDIMNKEHVNNVLVKCENAFTEKSFVVPNYNELYYRCLMPRIASIVQPFLTPSVLNLVNANDIEGAIRELGGNTETKDNIVQVVSKNLQREIYNKEREKEYVKQLDLESEAKASRLNYINTDLQKLRDKMEDLTNRMKSMTEDVCSICYCDMDNPIILSCTHMFCGQCIMKWIQTNEQCSSPFHRGKVCPNCRAPITGKQDLTAIVKEKKKAVVAAGPSRPAVDLSKIQTISKILSERPEGKFIIFSQSDYSFHELIQELQQSGITMSELKGTTHHMSKTLERFQSGEIRVILLNTNYAGSGIDISYATDVILFHNMKGAETQAIGRAQRVGRTSPLTVHRLCYPHEMPAV